MKHAAILGIVLFCLLSGLPACTGGSGLDIASHDARWARNLLDGVANDPSIAIPAILSLPETANGQVPAVLIVHGSAGIGERGAAYQEWLNAMGIATLRTDSFRPRGVASTYADQSTVTTYAMVADAFAGLKFLAAHPRIDPDRIAIMGFSKGGSVAQLTAFEPLRAAVVGGPERFAAHIAFYRACMFDVNMPLTGAPVRELLGGADDYVGPDNCLAYAARQKAAGADYDAVVYPGAHHGFNGTKPPVFCKSCVAYARCSVRLDADGSTTDLLTGTRLTLENQGPLLRACIDQGATVGNDPDAARRSRQFVQDFLRERFSLR